MDLENLGKKSLACTVAGILALAAATPVLATTVAVANGGSLFLTETTTSAGSSAFGTISAPTNPGNFTYSDSWTAAQTTPVTGTSSGFFDDFVFTISPGQVDLLTSSISLGNFLGISGMKVELYDYAANGSVTPLETTPLPGTGYDPWSSTVAFPGGTSTVSVLQPVTLHAGTYVIEVKGTASGSSGGNYTGSLNLTPVPVPATAWLMLSGIGGLGIMSRRRKAIVA
jgi:hypothetical protein